MGCMEIRFLVGPWRDGMGLAAAAAGDLMRVWVEGEEVFATVVRA